MGVGHNCAARIVNYARLDYSVTGQTACLLDYIVSAGPGLALATSGSERCKKKKIIIIKIKNILDAFFDERGSGVGLYGDFQFSRAGFASRRNNKRLMSTCQAVVGWNTWVIAVASS